MIMKRFFSLLMITVMLLALFTACNAGKTYTVEELSLTLPDGYVEVPQTLRGASFESETMAVKIIRESRSVVEAAAGGNTVTLTAYAELVLQSNRLELPLTDHGNYIAYQYIAHDEEVAQDFTYYVTLHKSDDAYWLVQFIAHKNLFDGKASEINDILESLSFS